MEIKDTYTSISLVLILILIFAMFIFLFYIGKQGQVQKLQACKNIGYEEYYRDINDYCVKGEYYTQVIMNCDDTYTKCKAYIINNYKEDK